MSSTTHVAAAQSRDPTVRIWILEDDIDLCQLLDQRCAKRGWSLAAFHEPRLLESALETKSPDLLLLDQMLPLKSGIDVLSSLRHAGYRFPVLMLSALNAPSDRIAGLEHGADDYLGKPFVFRELQLRIERLLRAADPSASEMGDRREDSAESGAGTSPFEAEDFQIGTLHFCPRHLQLQSPDGSTVRLSRGDTALLVALCRHSDAVVSRTTLAQACGSLVDLNQSRTIDVRMSRLRRLLHQLQPDQAGLEACRGLGYRLHGVHPFTPRGNGGA